MGELDAEADVGLSEAHFVDEKEGRRFVAMPTSST
jgi:hypothetical protein